MKPKKTYFQSYKNSYTAEFPCIKKSNKGEKYAYCTICFSDFLISHGGRNDIHRHVTGPNHAKNIENAENNQRLSKFFKPPDNVQDEVMRAELLFTSFLVEHNVPLNAASHVGPLFRKMFPKSEIAKRYGCAKTKTASLVHEMAMDRTSEIIKYLQEQAFTAACDGSHEADYKLYPVVVSYFNVDLQRIESTLLAIPNLEGNSTGENISSLLLNVFAKYDIPFRNCIAFSADNASVMQGKKNGVISFLEKENEHIISIGCCCHLIHLASEKAAATFPVRIDEVLVDIFYHLKRSVNRKDSLKKFQEMYGKEAQKVLKHVSTRWLSLGRSLTRLVNQWDPLTSYFRAEVSTSSVSVSSTLSFFKIPKVVDTESNTRVEKLKDKPKVETKTHKQDPTNDKKRKSSQQEIVNIVKRHKAQKDSSTLSKEEKIFMFLSSDLNKCFSLFLLNVIPTFEKVNVILQSSSPQIHRLRALLLDMLKELFSKFVKPSEVKGKELTCVNFHSSFNHKDQQDLVIGNAAMDLISNSSEEEKSLFYSAVIKYFITACEYIIKKFPLNDQVLKHAEVADLNKIENSSFESVRYFVNLFPFLLKTKSNETKLTAMDELQKQFCQLQLEDLSEITVPDRSIDVQWSMISQMKGADGMFKYEKLGNIVLSILLIPHSNSECERIFSLVRKNRTESRTIMSNKTLESLLILKTKFSKICHEQVFEKDFLIKAKKATSASLNSASSFAVDLEENP
nr:uncharacterized protein LOC122269520 [Parasteatoda tepidariorum]